MGTAGVRRGFARTVVGCATLVVAWAGLTGIATAAPADRTGDPVVLTGSEIPPLNGVDPLRIVAFSYTNAWKQVPVQVDERHTIGARKLYPSSPTNGYVGADIPSRDFQIEVYADPKTRSGSDADTTFDGDDELVFMASDSGQAAPIGAGKPDGVTGDGVAVKVDDGIGGGSNWVYLFVSDGNIDPSAGINYVDYDFKLTGLNPGQTVLNDYGYFNSFNHEDSTVTTSAYRLHSWDRWMEDEMRITVGGADGRDILDREVAQATLTGCGRSEYTFSGNWTLDSWPDNDGNTDSEGTYVTLIDGPVRAIRSYMGANSGPYTQREHIYYREREDNTIFLRVHPMTDLYAWTDFSEEAFGMTYTDMMNPGGVTVDGVPDTIEPTTTNEVIDGNLAWQQLTGPQGTITTILGAKSDLPVQNFGNYYLDKLSPNPATERQCGGDLKSIGAHGFGILGPVTLNTDPRPVSKEQFGGSYSLTVDRSRYFGAPGGTTPGAEKLTRQVAEPLTSSVSGYVPVDAKAKLKLTLVGKRPQAKRGKKVRLRMKVRNVGNVRLDRVKVCLSSRVLNGRTCRKPGVMSAGKSRVIRFAPTVKRRAKGKKAVLKFAYSSTGAGVPAVAGLKSVRLKLRR